MSILLPDYVHFTSSISSQLAEVLQALNPDKIGLLVDENTKKYCLDKIDLDPTVLVEIQSGEQHKNLSTCERVWEALTNASFTRKSALINLGGGVIGDMGGFIASTYKRGIPFINIPTTLLSQVDASVGGKLGVDFNGLKNHIGVFKDPEAVIIDPIFLETLPPRELVSGYAEVIKHALIFDAAHWEALRKTPIESLNWSSIIQKSVSIKNEVVSNDPFEKGMRKILNFGHTLGHAIESHWLDTSHHLLHGEAVAVGMILESHLSLQLGKITQEDFEMIAAHVHRHFKLPDSLPSYEELLPLLQQDKKNEHNNLSFSLLEGVGKCSFDQIVSQTQIEDSIKAYTR